MPQFPLFAALLHPLLAILLWGLLAGTASWSSWCSAAPATTPAQSQADTAKPLISTQPLTASQALEFALPPIKPYLPDDYRAERQNWAVLQAPSGMMYFANGGGVLEFDGLRWRLMPLSVNAVARSMALDNTNARIYVGGADDLGFLAPDAAGLLQYQSLLAQLPPEQRQFGNVWQTTATPQGVFFTTSQRLFRISPSGVTSWPAQKFFVRSTWFKGKLYIRDEGVGLMVLDNDQLKLAPDGARFADNRISAMLELPSGQAAGQLLIVSRQLGFLRYDGQSLKPWPTEIDAELQTLLPNTVRFLRDGQLAVGTTTGGLFLLDEQGRKVGQVTRQLGLPDNSVFDLWQDHEQGLWVATSGGLTRLQMGSALNQFDHRHGLEGTVYAIERVRGQLYVGTSQGLFRLQGTALPRFVPVAGVPIGVLALLHYREQLLVGTTNGVYRVHAGGAELLYTDDSIASFLLLPGEVPQLLAGTLQGIAVLQAVGDSWRFTSKISGLSGNVIEMQRQGNDTLWINNRLSGVEKLTYPSGKLLQGPAQITSFGVKDGLAQLHSNSLMSAQGQLRLFSGKNVYRYDINQQRLVDEPLFAKLAFDGKANAPRILVAPEGLWLDRYHWHSRTIEVGLAVLPPDGQYQWQFKQQVGNLPLTSRYRDANGVLWYGALSLLQLQPERILQPKVPFNLILRQIQTRDGSTMHQADTAGNGLVLTHDQNKLRFEYAATSYLGSNEYAVRLDGVDSDWSDWSKEAFVDYNSLWEGSYLLNVKARNPAGVEAFMSPLLLQVDPPWFRTYWAYAAYLLFVLVLINRWHHWRSSRLRAEALLLNQLVDQRTADLSKAKTEVEQTLTSLKSTQRQLVRAEKMAALGQLVAGVAHEVNTPLGVALTGSSFLRESTEILAGQLGSGQLRKQELDNFLGSALESSQLIERNLQRAADLISNFKQVSVDRSSGERRQFNLRGFLLEVEQSLETLWRNRPVQFIVDCPADIQLDTYPGALSQVITILAQNSLLHGFAADGGGEMLLCVRASDPEQVEIVFADNGAGIATEHLEKVFEPFFTTKRAHGGTGLGLHILFNLVSERLGGTVTVESGYEGRGCAFILILPRMAPQPVA